jgi:probable phosphoglycerate mutase
VSLSLIRHGETDWNREPARCQGWAEIGLNETGRAQARDQGRALRRRGLELIVSSHLARARETAAIIREELGGDLPLVLDPRLAETHRGDWESRLFAEIMLEEADVWRHYREHPEDFRFPAGESLADQQRRVLAVLRDAARDGRPALFVTHAGSIRLVRCFLDGRGIAAFHETTTSNGGIDEIDSAGLDGRIATFLAERP